jgi:hypothetical protein
MSRIGIQTGIEELERKLVAERAIAERFPDARLYEMVNGDAVWMSESASEHTTDVALITTEEYRDWERDHGRPRISITVLAYLTIEGMRVYAEPGMTSHHLVWLSHLKEKQPEVYKALVEAAR